MNREEELLRKKAKVFDLYTEIEELKKEIKELENTKELEVQETIQEEVTPETVQNEVQEQSVIVESAPSEETSQETAPVTPIFENNEVNTVPQTDAPVQEEVTEPEISSGPLIQPEPEEVKQEIPEQQVVSQESVVLTEPEVQNVQEPIVDKKVIIKTDSNAPKAIIVSTEQYQKSKAAKDLEEGMVLGSEEKSEAAGQVIELPVGAATVAPLPEPLSPSINIPTGEAIATTELNSQSAAASESLEEIDAMMKDLVDELVVTTDEARANEINNNIAALNEKKMVLTKKAE